VRKPKKLPAKTVQVSYALEYGTDTLEIHEDAVQKGQRVLVCDDLLAQGNPRRRRCSSYGNSAGRSTGRHLRWN